jgi:AcrR family transcriptional regulator
MPANDQRVPRPGTRGHRTRERILSAGARAFSERGYHSARVDDVVRIAESSHGTFYLYFTSKEDLFQQLIGQAADEIALLVDDMPRITNSAKGRTDLRAWLDRFADLYERTGDVIRTWTEAELSGDRVGQHGDDAMGSLVTTLMSRMRIPKRSGLDPAIAALALITLCERFNYYATTGQVELTRDELLTTLVDVIDAVVFAK